MCILALALRPVEPKELLNVSGALRGLGHWISALGSLELLVAVRQDLVVALLHLLSVSRVLVLYRVKRLLLYHWLFGRNLLGLS